MFYIVDSFIKFFFYIKLKNIEYLKSIIEMHDERATILGLFPCFFFMHLTLLFRLLTLFTFRQNYPPQTVDWPKTQHLYLNRYIPTPNSHHAYVVVGWQLINFESRTFWSLIRGAECFVCAARFSETEREFGNQTEVWAWWQRSKDLGRDCSKS